MITIKKRKSFTIKNRIALLIIFCIATLTAANIIVTSGTLNEWLTIHAAEEMNTFCREQGADLNKELLRMEDPVNSLASWTTDKVKSADDLKNDQEKRDALIEEAEDILLFMTVDNEFIQSVYMHYTIDITGKTDRNEGAYYTRGANGEFELIPFTQAEIADDPMSQYWYYDPIENKAPMWTKPYYEWSINDHLISYVSPVCVDGEPIAIIGIDCSFSRMVRQVDNIRYHATGYMYMKAADGSVHYHTDYLDDKDIHGDEKDNVQNGEELMTQKDTGRALIRYKFHGRDRVMTFITLRNNIKLVLCDSYDEIFLARNKTIAISLAVSLGLALLFGSLALLMASHITKPLNRLTKIAIRLSDGDYNVIFPDETNDEIGTLVRVLKTAVLRIHQRSNAMKERNIEQERQIEEKSILLSEQSSELLSMRNIAYIDSLTHVKSKKAYDDTVQRLEKQIATGTAEFAIVMCDLNYLKRINDTLGHKAGDEALIRASRMICRSFPLSSVFRIGGDEFVVILTDMEYDERERLLEEFRIMLQNEVLSTDNIFDKTSIAFGCSAFNRQKDTSFAEVFERADKAMYADKCIIRKRDNIEGR